jgi:UDPglucose 6-dehydrogenase
MRIVFSPEFLTERNSVDDFRNCNRIIVAGDDDDTDVVFKFFYAVCHERANNGKVMLYAEPDPTTAELGKLMGNAFLATKVIFCNELQRIAKKLNLDYDSVRAIASLDPRIGPSHTMVPGPDGQFGFGGHCFPKDLANLIHTAKVNGVEEKLLSLVSERNVELRESKDWENMEGRAVIKE